MDINTIKKEINSFWDSQIVPTLIEYIKIPNKSPSFDSEWKKRGHMDKVFNLATTCTNKNLPLGSTLTVK